MISFDVGNRNIVPPIGNLSSKQFTFLLYLGLKRTDTSDGWVELEDVVERVPLWMGQKPTAAGGEISRIQAQSWFGRLVTCQVPTRGPYQLAERAEFLPSRDAANLFIAQTAMARRLRKTAPPRRHRITPTELQAYDMLVQHGVFLTPVVDLIIQRLGDPARIDDARQRLTAFRILATLGKNRKHLDEALVYVEKGLKLAKTLRRNDDYAYLLDQMGGIHYIRMDGPAARAAFEEEIAFLKNWGAPQATFHLVGAYRGLASVLRAQGDEAGAFAALRESVAHAAESANEEGERLAEIERFRQGSRAAKGETDERRLDEIPTEHLVGRIMALNARAEAYLSSGERSEGERLLRLALRESLRLDLQNEVDKARALAEMFGIRMDNGKGEPGTAS